MEAQKTELKEEKKTETKEEKEESKPKEGEKVEVKEKKKSADGLLKVVQPVKSTIRRSGLKIVKKKKPKVEENYSIPANQASVSSYGKMSAEALEELARKKKSKQTTVTAKKQDQGKKIDIFGGSLAEVSMDMDDQVVLLDLNSTERRNDA